MKRDENYEFSMYVKVFDPVALLRAARFKAASHGIEADEIESVTDALSWLLDPGVSPPGCQILDSICE